MQTPIKAHSNSNIAITPTSKKKLDETPNNSNKIKSINLSETPNPEKKPDSDVPSITSTPIKSTPQKPTKQGLIYSLDLGQNNGPFLLKDINLSNTKSIRLLLNSNESKRVASEALNVLEGTHSNKMDINAMNKIFDDWEGLVEAKLGIKKPAIFKLTEPSKEEIDDCSEKDEDKKKEEELNLSNVDERYKTKLANIENITNEIIFNMETVRKMQEDLKLYWNIIEQLKKDIANLKGIINSLDNETLKKQLIPFIKEYYTNHMKHLMKQEETELFQMKKEMAQLIRDKAHLLLQIDWAEKKIKKDEKFIGVYIYRHLSDQKK